MGNGPHQERRVNRVIHIGYGPAHPPIGEPDVRQHEGNQEAGDPKYQAGGEIKATRDGINVLPEKYEYLKKKKKKKKLEAARRSWTMEITTMMT